MTTPSQAGPAPDQQERQRRALALELENDLGEYAKGAESLIRDLLTDLAAVRAQLQDAQKEALISRNDKRMAEADLSELRARMALPTQA